MSCHKMILGKQVRASAKVPITVATTLYSAFESTLNSAIVSYRIAYTVQRSVVTSYCESKKLCHFYFYCNFGKCWSIFKILSMSESRINGS